MEQISKNQLDNQRADDGAARPPGLSIAAGRRRTLLLLAVAALSLLFFSLTSPKSVSSPLLIVGFVMLGLLLYGVLRLLLLVSGLHVRLPKAYRRGLLLGGTVLPVILLMLQSIGQLTLRDILTLSGLFIIGVFYIGHVSRGRLT